MPISDRNIGIAGVVLGVIGAILGVLGIAFGYYFYTSSVQEKLPSFAIDPSRASIVSYDQNNISDLSVLYKGRPVNQNSVIAARVYFWNAGSSPINHSDVLKKIKIIFPISASVLDYRILNYSRDITGLKVELGPPPAEQNTVLLDFNILEKNDGGAIQIIYTGSSDVPIRFDGTVVGAQNLNLVHTYTSERQVPMLEKLYSTRGLIIVSPGILLIFIMLILSIIAIYGRIRHNWLITTALILGGIAGFTSASLSLWIPYQPLSAIPKEILPSK